MAGRVVPALALVVPEPYFKLVGVHQETILYDIGLDDEIHHCVFLIRKLKRLSIVIEHFISVWESNQLAFSVVCPITEKDASSSNSIKFFIL
jgi:hypothetical protein